MTRIPAVLPISALPVVSHILIDTDEPTDLRKRLYPGLVIGGGFEAPAGRARLIPELRLTHWTANISRPESPGTLRFPSNQVEVFLGVLF